MMTGQLLEKNEKMDVEDGLQKLSEKGKRLRKVWEELENEMEMTFEAISCNESLARTAVAAFITPLNPTLEEMADVKTAVSEAVTNAIIHGYGNVQGYCRHGETPPCHEEILPGKVTLRCRLEKGILSVDVSDRGRGIDDIGRAMEPFYTSKPELERSGMGFALMEAFMDHLEVTSVPGEGTWVHMEKKMYTGSWMDRED